ncbi:septum formation protein Maf [Roseospira marina]|uniref:Nucleoside triphosphate pyrophosphatase n=1 Tax=Roseospira marina TaxID=140057 RepID=A0A5M6ID85_9PROT|nr:Maf family protein [Roseospira marina]KAA5606241.1 septum formation protein Maf [Roseospira marina]MBB4314394.1 septum formation protein [Roseospira marina]MBB5087554.1 septum formation protein [Roseospira marina]
MTDTDPRNRADGTAPPAPLILASGSATRRALLERAGVPIAAIDPPEVDEAAIRADVRREGRSGEAAAMALAIAKARVVSVRHAGALVLGADQILETEDGAWLEKPADRAAARAQLRRLSGTTHRLISAAVLMRDGADGGQVVDSAALTLRPLSDRFLDTYIATVGDGVLSSVGAYQIEGVGLQLFSIIDGDYFTILGLPMVAVLALLRTHGVVGT